MHLLIQSLTYAVSHIAKYANQENIGIGNHHDYKAWAKMQKIRIN